MWGTLWTYVGFGVPFHHTTHITIITTASTRLHQHTT
jgi:hypothetical protein